MKKLGLMFLSLVLFSVVLTACGNDDAEGNGGSDSDEVTISLWLTPQWKGVVSSDEEGADYDSFFKHAAERFEEEYEKHDVNVEIEVIAADQRDELLNVNLNGGTPPDVFFESTFAMGDYVHRGAIAPITDIIDDEAKSDIAESYWDVVSFGEDIYFYPFSSNPGTLSYNADMFRAAGLDDFIAGEDEIATWTLEEFENILYTLRDDLPTDEYSNAFPMSLFALNNQGDTWNLSYLRMFGNEFFDENGNIILNDESGIKAMEWLKKIKDEELSNPGPESVSSNDALAMFQNQQIGVNFTNAILFNNIKNDMADGVSPEFDMRLANIPSADGGALEFTYVTGSAVFDTGDATRMEVAKDFVKFYSSDPELVEAQTNGIPVRSSVASEFASENPKFAAYEENSEYLFNFSGNVPGYNELRQVLYPELQALYTGEKSPEEAVESYQEKGNDVINNAKEDSVIYAE